MTLSTDKTKKQFEELIDLIKKGDYFEYRELLGQFQDINYQISSRNIFIMFFFTIYKILPFSLMTFHFYNYGVLFLYL